MTFGITNNMKNHWKTGEFIIKIDFFLIFWNYIDKQNVLKINKEKNTVKLRFLLNFSFKLSKIAIMKKGFDLGFTSYPDQTSKLIIFFSRSKS